MNVIKRIFLKQESLPLEANKERVSSEQLLVDRVSSLVAEILPNQKMEITLTSVQAPQLVTKMIFAYKEEDSFKEPTREIAIEIDDPSKDMNEENPLEIRYNVYSTLSLKKTGSNWSSYSQESKELKGIKEWNPKTIEEKEPFCFFETAEQLSVDGKRAFTPDTLKKLHSIAVEKLNEIHPMDGFIKSDSDWMTFQSPFRFFQLV